MRAAACRLHSLVAVADVKEAEALDNISIPAALQVGAEQTRATRVFDDVLERHVHLRGVALQCVDYVKGAPDHSVRLVELGLLLEVTRFRVGVRVLGAGRARPHKADRTRTPVLFDLIQEALAPLVDVEAHYVRLDVPVREPICHG